MARRINVILPDATVKTIDRLARPGQRSRFIERAVQHYVSTATLEVLQERLREAALRDRDLDLEIAADWAVVDQEPWQELDAPKRRDKARQSGAKSISRPSTRR